MFEGILRNAHSGSSNDWDLRYSYDDLLSSKKKRLKKPLKILILMGIWMCFSSFLEWIKSLVLIKSVVWDFLCHLNSLQAKEIIFVFQFYVHQSILLHSFSPLSSNREIPTWLYLVLFYQRGEAFLHVSPSRTVSPLCSGLHPVSGCIQCQAAQSWLLLAPGCSFRWEVLFLPPTSEASGLLFVSHRCTFSSPSHKSSLN